MPVSTCLHHAITIQRTIEPKHWPEALLAVPDDCRAECDAYLRGIAARMRVKRAIEQRILPREF